MHAMEHFDGQNFGMAGKTIGSFRRNVFYWLKIMLLSRGYAVKEHRADNMFIVSKNGKSNNFYMFGGGDERAQDLVQGVTCAGFFFDEVALMAESFVNQATGRCSVDGSKLWFNDNPDGPYHWFKTGWIDKKEEKNMLYLHFTMDDNLSLTERIKKRYRSMYSGVFYERYILGLWTIAEGIIYDMFDKNIHVCDKDEMTFNGDCYVSCDYGTQNATTFLLWEKNDEGIWIATREYYYSGREESKQKTDNEYLEDLMSWLDGKAPRKIIIDPSAASFIALLKKNGFKIKKAKNDVMNGIRYVGELLNEAKIGIDNECENTIREFNSYRWDEKASARGEDKPIKEHDHCMDALRYFCYTVIRKPDGIQVLK